MTARSHRWVVVLAAGDGTRLQSLTTDATGRPIPKQFCALRGTRSMLQETLDRAKRLVPHARIVVIVAAQHRRWWLRELRDIPPTNVVVQPLNRGTAAGVLLPFLLIHARDPQAQVVVMPSDHFVERNDILHTACEEALLGTTEVGNPIVLLAMTPEVADPEYGWILPAGSGGNSTLPEVAAFVEKPEGSVARDLMRRGALISTFIFAARSRSLLRLYRRQNVLLRQLGSIIEGRMPETFDEGDLARLYESLPCFDFSRDLLRPSPAQALQVLAVPSCGWNDLGTTGRVVTCLRRHRGQRSVRGSGPTAVLDLAEVAGAANRCVGSNRGVTCRRPGFANHRLWDAPAFERA